MAPDRIAPTARTIRPLFSQSWKRQMYSRRSDSKYGYQVEPPRHRKSIRDDGSWKGKSPQKSVRFNETVMSSLPGSPAWIVELILAALGEEGDIFVMQRAMQTISALDRDGSRWRDVNMLLANISPHSVAAAATLLAEREEEAQTVIDHQRVQAGYDSELVVLARNFSHEDMQGNVYSGCTYYIKPPSDWKARDFDGKPPEIEGAPLFCLFLMPKRPYDPEDPYRIWLLDENRRWNVVQQYTAHPDPRYHPRILRLQPIDKTPNWVLPDSVRRKSGKKPVLVPLPASQPASRPNLRASSSPPSPTLRSQSSLGGTGVTGANAPSSSTAGAAGPSRAGPSRTHPSWSRVDKSAA